MVALRKESVDRNILGFGFCIFQCGVALRKESVDRNLIFFRNVYDFPVVALRKESVDRNTSSSVTMVLETRRSPQGERG